MSPFDSSLSQVIIMRLLILTLFIASTAASRRLTVGDPQFDDHWELYKVNYEKHYGEDITTEGIRRLIWEDNVIYIKQHNIEAALGLHTYILGINQFTDLTNDEFRARLNSIDISEFPRLAQTSDVDVNALPNSVDWRTKNLVTPVKDQGDCGSCWSFSTTGAVEGQHANKTGQLVSLSEQNLIECDTLNKGCAGGNPMLGFIYIKNNGGVDTEESYPYVGQKGAGACKFDPKGVGATVTGWRMASQGNEQALQKAVAQVGPISVLIDAGKRSFQLYKSGVYYEPNCSSKTLNHAVLAVGYGSDDGQDYWLVKNSWAARWGEKGYIRMARNKKNMCGIASVASYPTV